MLKHNQYSWTTLIQNLLKYFMNLFYDETKIKNAFLQVYWKSLLKTFCLDNYINVYFMHIFDNSSSNKYCQCWILKNFVLEYNKKKETFIGCERMLKWQVNMCRICKYKYKLKRISFSLHWLKHKIRLILNSKICCVHFTSSFMLFVYAFMLFVFEAFAFTFAFALGL